VLVLSVAEMYDYEYIADILLLCKMSILLLCKMSFVLLYFGTSNEISRFHVPFGLSRPPLYFTYVLAYAGSDPVA